MESIETKDKKFQLRSYGFGELAQLYNPHIAQCSASHKLRRWILVSKELAERLAETAYKPYAKVLTPKQVEIIIKHLGEP